METLYDVLIIGGGPAGLSAALTLARGGRRVVIFDNQKPRNAPAKLMYNFPSHDGVPPLEFRNQIKRDLKKYSNVEFENLEVDELTRTSEGFKAIASGKIFFGRKIMLAHGLKDEVPTLPGFQELWGQAVFQCPYCHGHEYRNQPMALIGGGMMIKHMLPLLKGLTQDLVAFTNGEEIEERELIEKNGIKIYQEKIIGLDYEGEHLKGVKLEKGTYVPRSFIFMKVPQKLSTDLAVKLGCEVLETGYYKIDEMGKTTQDGIYAAGDIVSMRQSVLMAASGGQLAAASLNYELLHEEFLKV